MALSLLVHPDVRSPYLTLLQERRKRLSRLLHLPKSMQLLLLLKLLGLSGRKHLHYVALE
jgi:hypothetical protein